MKTMFYPIAIVSALEIAACGCISVKTESEVKPIHITMDINLKVDKELDKVYADENQSRSETNRRSVRDLLDRQVAGVSSSAALVARDKASDDDRIRIAEANARQKTRFAEIAKSAGVSLETVQKRYAGKMRDRLPAGCGVWYQDDAGKWLQK